jgi:CelD/BcsL family acetyltransferase involved in cellulose biosynthesis
MLDVHEINRLDELDAHRAAWRGLLHETPNYSFFQSLEWLEATWRNYPLRQRLRVLVLRRDNQPVGIVPLCVRTERRKLGRLRVLTYPLDDWGTFYGPIGPDPKAAIRAAVQHIANTPRDWDFIDLRWVDEAADEFLTLGEALREAAFDFRVRPRMEVRMCRFADGWDAYQKSRSRNWRRKMRLDIEALERAGPVRLVRHRPGAGEAEYQRDDEIFDVCQRLAEHTWQAEAESQSTLCSPRVRDVFRRVHHAAAALGMLDVNILYVGDAPAAYNYNYIADGRVYGLRCGYDATLELEGCGRVLLYKMLEDGFRRGDVEYNFGPGRQAYKERFATEMRYAYTFRHYARYSLRSQILNLRDRVVARLCSEQSQLERHLVT